MIWLNICDEALFFFLEQASHIWTNFAVKPDILSLIFEKEVYKHYGASKFLEENNQTFFIAD